MAIHYLTHPVYRDYPVVGISYSQARDYSRWRSDRVMQVFLWRAGVLSALEDGSGDDHFTIERFYATDSLKAYHYLPYPSYDLPTVEEWRSAVGVSDSLIRSNVKRCGKLERRPFFGHAWSSCDEVLDNRQFIINSKEQLGQLGMEKLVPSSCYLCWRELIWQIRGNVSELSLDSMLVLGGSYADPLDSILLEQPFPNMAPNNSTGFRNVCRWRKWNGI